MTMTLYVVPGSHPCAAVERALRVKALPYERVDLLPVAHNFVQRRRFGAGTVPGIVFDSGEKLTGSAAILRRLDELVPEPPLLPGDRLMRAEVVQAARWGEEVLQPVARRLVWAALKRDSGAMMSYTEGARLPVPRRLAALAAGGVAAAEVRIHGASDPDIRADLVNLPHHLARIDAWIDNSVLAGSAVNAADLQIGAGVRLLLTLGDVEPLIAGRPAGALARRHFPEYPGHVPKGTLPASWFREASTSVGARLVPEVTL
jgi:glutathione S-transferase